MNSKDFTRILAMLCAMLCCGLVPAASRAQSVTELENQAEAYLKQCELDKSLESAGRKIDAIINLKINDSVVAERMTGRRSCPVCGSVYHIENLKPKTEGVCDNDGAELVQRPDDTLEVVENRLKTYHEQTEPVVAYYKNNNTVYDIDANASADEVSSLVFENLNSFVNA